MDKCYVCIGHISFYPSQQTLPQHQSFAAVCMQRPPKKLRIAPRWNMSILQEYVITCLLFRDEIISPLLWIIFKMFLLKKVKVAKGKRFRRTVLRKQWYYNYCYILLLFHYIIIIIVVVEGCQQRAEGSKRQCCKTNYTKCITTEPLWSRYSNPHCK